MAIQDSKKTRAKKKDNKLFDPEMENRLKNQRRRVNPPRERTKNEKVQTVTSMFMFAIFIGTALFTALRALNLLGN